MGKLWKTLFKWLDIEGLKAAQRNELIVPGQNTAFPQREGLSECREIINETYISGGVSVETSQSTTPLTTS